MFQLDLKKQFNKIITLIRQDVINGIKRGNFNETSFHANAESTIKQKGHRHPLQGKGRNGVWLDKTKYAITKATTQKQEASITIPNSDIASYNQAPTGNGTIKNAREFWGISKKVENMGNKLIDDELNDQFDKEMKKAGFKKI